MDHVLYKKSLPHLRSQKCFYDFSRTFIVLVSIFKSRIYIELNFVYGTKYEGFSFFANDYAIVPPPFVEKTLSPFTCHYTFV